MTCDGRFLQTGLSHFSECDGDRGVGGTWQLDRDSSCQIDTYRQIIGLCRPVNHGGHDVRARELLGRQIQIDRCRHTAIDR